MTFGTVLDIIAIILIPFLLTFLLGSVAWEMWLDGRENEEAERQFEEDMMRLYGGQEDDSDI